MGYLDEFVAWVERSELSTRHDAARVAEELRWIAGEVAAAGHIEPGDVVLDIGCGTGAMGLAAADLGGRVIGVDIELEALHRGRMLCGRIGAPFVHIGADASRLPFQDRSFDASVHRSVLVYMENREAAVREERRVLRSGGRVSCSESVGAELDLVTDDPGIDRVWQGGLRQILIDAASASGALSAPILQRLYIDSGFDEVSVDQAPHGTSLLTADDIARAFTASPPRGSAARAAWERAGVPGPLLDEFLARLTREAERGRSATLLAEEVRLTARA